MRWDWDKVEDVRSRLPEGKYAVRVVDVEDDLKTQSRDVGWRIHLDVIEGPFRGASLTDAIFWSAAAIKRVKLVLKRLGFDLEGNTNIEPDDLVDRKAIVDVTVERYVDPRDGATKETNKISFGGWFYYIPGEAERLNAADQGQPPEETSSNPPDGGQETGEQTEVNLEDLPF